MTWFCFIIIFVFVAACCAADHQTDVNSANVVARCEQRRKSRMERINQNEGN